MMLEHWVAGAMLIALLIYAVSGGADFGGGVWDLMARGPRADAQRRLIAGAIAPIWEANHVWLIVVVVVLFVGFPRAFAAISIVLHIPLALMLVGIVLRGAAFAFRSHEIQSERARSNWSRVFAVASVISPIFLGIVIGAIASGTIRVPLRGPIETDFVSAWLAPFPIAVGVLTLTLFAFLAAIYLATETTDTALQDDFRRRALIAGGAVASMALVTLLLARHGAPQLYATVNEAYWPLLLALVALLLGALVQWALWTRRFAIARWVAPALVATIVVGWALAQFPLIVMPDLALSDAAAPPRVLESLLAVLVIASALILPAFAYLYYVFKRRPQSDVSR